MAEHERPAWKRHEQTQYDERLIVFWGDAKFINSPISLQGMLRFGAVVRKLRQATDFHLLDEYKASQTCPVCLKAWVKKHYPGDPLHPCYKIKWCPGCELVMGRDLGSCKCMMTPGVNTLRGIPRTSENVGNLARPAAPVDDEVMVDPEIQALHEFIIAGL